MANVGPNTAHSDLFIEADDFLSLDATATDIGFAAFGRLVEGQDVAKGNPGRADLAHQGEGSMKGQMLELVVKIVKAERVK